MAFSNEFFGSYGDKRMNQKSFLNVGIHFIFAGFLVFTFWDSLISLVNSWILDPSYQHGLIVLLVCFILAYLAFKKQGFDFDWQSSEHWRKRLPWLVLAFTVTFFGFLNGFQYVILIGFLLSLRFWGGKALNFPLFYLFLVIPFPGLPAITVYLQRFNAQAVASFMHFFGFSVHDKGNFLHLPDFSFEIVPSCTGVHSFLSLLSLMVLFVYFMKLKNTFRVFMVLFCIPIALISNFLRLVLLLIIAFPYGQESAMYYWHYFGGVMFYLVALSGLLALLGVLKKVQKESVL